MEAPYKNINEDLIDGIKAKNEKAQLQVYKLFYKAMYNTSLRILNNTAEAEDIMQDSFLDAFTKIHIYSGEGSFGSWLKRIVINNSLDALKKRKELTDIDENKFEIKEDDDKDNYIEQVSYKVEEIKKAITRLPDDYRIILSLFLLEGYDHNEISLILNISNNASRTRYSRAKKKLLRILAEQKVMNTLINPN